MNDGSGRERGLQILGKGLVFHALIILSVLCCFRLLLAIRR
jgi:hypothetical protein